MRTLVALFAAGVIAAAIGGCSRQTSTSGVTVLRVVQNMPDQDRVDVFWASNLFKQNMDYKDSSGYIQVPGGFEQFLAVNPDTGQRLVEADFFLEDDRFYTILPTGVGLYAPIFLEDDRTVPPPGKMRLRFVGAAQGGPAIDVYLAHPQDNTADLTPVQSDIGFSDVGQYFLSTVGAWEIRITFAGTKDQILNSGLFDFFDGQVRTILFVEARGGGTPYALQFLQDLN